MADDNNGYTVTVYEPNHVMKAGIRIWTEMIKELIDFRGLIWRLIARDISAKYRQSILGIFWAFITPMIMMFVFVWIKNRNILPIRETSIPYAVFLFSGQMVWFLFSQGTGASVRCLVESRSMFKKINFPCEVLLFSCVGQTVFNFIIRIPLWLLVCAYSGFSPNIGVLLVPFTLIPLLLFIIGLGFYLAPLNAMTRDTGNAIAIVLNLFMFATPVIYPPPESWPLSFLINTLNPVSSFIISARDLMTNGTLSDPSSYLISVILSLLIFFTGWRMFHLIETKIAERV